VKVHDNLLSYAAAIDLFDKYKSEGYYNVFIGNQFKGKL
jgi:hypothetical protein